MPTKETVMNAKFLIFGALVALPLSSHAFERKDAELAMTEAATALQTAERADAAPPDLGVARDMMSNAQIAYDHHHWEESVFYAEDARADADLAATRSRQHRAEAATVEIERSVRALNDQLSNGGQP
jgi:hypothetical protein